MGQDIVFLVAAYSYASQFLKIEALLKSQHELWIGNGLAGHGACYKDPIAVSAVIALNAVKPALNFFAWIGVAEDPDIGIGSGSGLPNVYIYIACGKRIICMVLFLHHRHKDNRGQGGP